MKIAAATLALALALFASACGSMQPTIDDRLGPLPLRLVALEETSVGSLSGRSSFGSGTISGSSGPGILFAFVGPEGDTHMVAVRASKVTISYGEAALLLDVRVRSVSTPGFRSHAHSQALGAMVEFWGHEIRIQLPEAEARKFLRFID